MAKTKRKRLRRPRFRVKRHKLDKGPFHQNPNISFTFTFSMREICDAVAEATGERVSPFNPGMDEETVRKILNEISAQLRKSTLLVLTDGDMLRKLHTLQEYIKRRKDDVRKKRNK